MCSFRAEDPDLDGPLDIESREELLMERNALDSERDFLLSTTGSEDSVAYWYGDRDPAVLAVDDLHFHFSVFFVDFIMPAGLMSSTES